MMIGLVLSCRDESDILLPTKKTVRTVQLKISPDTLVVSSIKPSPREPDPTTTIEFSLPVAAHVRLAVFDDINQLVALLVDQDLAPGLYSVTWHVENLASGVYYFRLAADNVVVVRKLVLVK